jgi:histidinol dehydrogenase
MKLVDIVKKCSENGEKQLKALKDRAEEVQTDVISAVSKILEDVKNFGDSAVIRYTNSFDSEEINIDNIAVTEEEIDEAYKNVDFKFIEALKEAKNNIEDFHQRQKRNSWVNSKEDGVILGQTVRALDKVGIYVPGGTAAYPSSVLMNAIPAKAAGVKNIYMVTPPSKDGSINPHILVAARIAGVHKIFKVGGAQAIGALAFGTKTLPKVDKIVGPGNIYVAMAKKSVYGYVDIDMIAGPSEILIIADENANPKYLAADLMSQAEHDTLASSILVTTSKALAEAVQVELSRQVETLSRKEIIKESIKNYGAIILVDSLEEAINTANELAPEHLELVVKDPFLALGEIKNAGSIFLGEYAPEPLGDYMAGPNHVLPTSSTARFFSPLSVDDFIKKSSFIYYSKTALEGVGDKIITIAEVEGLTAHANSIKVRFEEC